MTIAIVVMLVLGTFPSMFLFLVGTGLALMINYKKIKEQKARISENAGDALQVVILVFAAGIFMGLFTNSGMSDALANSLIYLIPAQAGTFLGPYYGNRICSRYFPSVQRRILLWRTSCICRSWIYLRIHRSGAWNRFPVRSGVPSAEPAGSLHLPAAEPDRTGYGRVAERVRKMGGWYLCDLYRSGCHYRFRTAGEIAGIASTTA